MPTKKKSTARKSATKKSRPKQPAHGGTYVTPKGNVSITVPPFWFFRQTNDDLELDSPTTSTSIVVSAFQRNGRNEPLDSRDYMKRFLQTAPATGRKTVTASTKTRTSASFKDGDGANWQCEFLTDGTTLLLVTMNSTEKPRSAEVQTATGVLASLKLVKRRKS